MDRVAGNFPRPEREPSAAEDAGMRFGRRLGIWGPGRFRARLKGANWQPRVWRGRPGSERAAKGTLGARE